MTDEPCDEPPVDISVRELEEQKLVAQGVLNYGAIYLTMVFVASLLAKAMMARNFAVATAGVSYLAFLVQYPPHITGKVAEALVGISIATGVMAGLCLMFGV